MKGNRIAIERILCPVDFSKFSVWAFDYASSLAHHFRAKLFAQNVVELEQYPSVDFAVSADAYDEFCSTMLSQGEARLRAFIQCHRRYEVDAEYVASTGRAADCILSFAKHHSIDLIVMGTHGYRGFERLMLGSVTERVLRMAPCSVLVVPQLSPDLDRPPASSLEIGPRQILVCLDFSEFSERALDHAIFVAEEYHAELQALHVVEDVSGPGFVDDIANAQKRMDELLSARTKSSSKIATIVKTGRAYREISQLARDIHAGLVIMGVHGRNSLDDAVFGSTIYRVILSGVCPVLAVHN